MDPIVRAVLASWSLDPWRTLPLLLVGVLYWRGWKELRLQLPQRFPPWRLAAFLAGLAAAVIAVASPLDPLGALLLQAHMAQHLLLMMVVPPLLWLGAPIPVLLRGLPRSFLKSGLGPFLAWRGLRRLARALVHPVAAWIAFVGATWVWHAPFLYELALRAPFWHGLEHLSFLATGLLFWWPVLQPWPGRSAWPPSAMLPYLALAALQNTVFSAVFAFAEQPIYSTYAGLPRLWGVSALEDQAIAGAVMWVPGSLIMVSAATVLVVGLLEPALPPRRPARRTAFRVPVRPPWDLLGVRIVGGIVRAKAFRRGLQMLMFALALAIVLDGWFGPRLSPMNLAGVLPWIHWRGLVVIALLVAGNLFCMACPFLLPRGLGRRILPGTWSWPKRLRSKWLAVALLILYLVAYEVFDLWNRPAWTAWIVVGYFCAALAIDGCFRGGSFCKYVCPIGQFHFASSTLSPLEVRVREPETCARCSTHDCIAGQRGAGGCELGLFQPAKLGNIDCTFCLDCVRACPHDNVGVLARIPARELLLDPPRSSLRRLSQRPDLAALAGVLSFGAFANAAGMLAPVLSAQERLATKLGWGTGWVSGVGLLFGIALVPALGVGVCAWVGRRWSRVRAPALELLTRFSWTLFPLGFSMWLVHSGFHLITGIASPLPVIQRSLGDLGVGILGPPNWAWSAVASMPSWLRPLELLLLGLGVLASLYLAWRIALQYAPRRGSALRLCSPWAGLALFLYAAGVWIVFQPMSMRGMLMP